MKLKSCLKIVQRTIIDLMKLTPQKYFSLKKFNLLLTTIALVFGAASSTFANTYRVSANSNQENDGRALIDNDTLIVEQGVSLDTKSGGVGDDGINDNGAENLTIIVNGTIDGDDDGIDLDSSTGSSVAVNAGGSVTGDDFGIDADADDIKIVVYGSVTGRTDDGILVDDDAEISVYGTVDGDEYGIQADQAAKIAVYENGSIYGRDEDGILVNDDAEIFVFGVVDGDGDGISADGGAQITVRGGTVTGANDDGIDVNSGAQIIIGYGSTVTGGDRGIEMGDAGQVTVESGATVTGTDDGISFSYNNTVNIYGSVIAIDDVAINANAHNNVINIHSGASISAGASAVEIEDASTLTIHAGATLRAGTNPNALSTYGIWARDNDNDIFISGTISASNSAAIKNGGELDPANNPGVQTAVTGNTFTFGQGARIIGDVDAGTGSGTLKFDVGSAQSYVFATTGSWTLEDLDGRAVVEGSAMAAGIGNAETADELMFDRSMSLNRSLGRLERQSAYGERQALFDAYGFSQSRDEDGTTSSYELDSRGMTIGQPLELLGNQAIAFFNYHDSEIDIANGTHDIDAQSLRIGLSVPQMWSGENYNIGVYAVAGRNFYDGLRDVLVNQNTTTGITSIAASWNSSEVELGIDAATSYQISPSLTLDSSLGLAAHAEHIGTYAEENYFAWDSRTIVQAQAKAEVTLGYQATDATRIYGTAGTWRRDVRSGETAHYTINNAAVSYNGGVYDDTISSLRFGLGHRLGNGAVISAEASAIDGGTTDRSYGASLGVAARF